MPVAVRRTLACAVALALLALPAARPAPAGAATTAPGIPVAQTGTTAPDPTPEPSPPDPDALRLVDQTDWVGAGGSFTIRIAVPPDLPEDAEVVLDLHRSVTSRSQFTATLDGALLGRRLTEVVVPLGELVPQPDGSRRIHLAAAPTGAPGERPLPPLPSSGVHPLVVSVRPPDPGGEAPAPFTTFLVRTPETVVQPLRVAVVQPFGADIAARPDGTVAFPPGAVAALAALADVLAGSDAPLSIVPTPETVDALARQASAGDEPAAEVLDALRRALPGRQLVAAPYVPVDPDALERAGLGQDLGAQRQRGADVVEAVLGARADDDTWVAPRATGAASLRLLAGLGVDQVVLPDASLEPVSLRLSLARPFTVPIDDRGTALDATAPEPALSSRYAATDVPLAASHLLADLAVLHGDEPGAQSPRGVVVAPPAAVPTDPAFLAAVVQGIEAAPHLAPVTLATYFAEVDAEAAGIGILERRTTASPEARLGIAAAELAATRDVVDGFASMVGDGPAAAALDRLRDLVLVAEADGLAPGERRAYLAGVVDHVHDAVGTIGVVDRAAYRLADSEGTIPLTLVHGAAHAVRVRVTLESDKLDFEVGDEWSEGRAAYDVTLTEENTPLVVPVAVRSPGTFPLVVSITSPDGRLQVLETRITVRSTAFSGVGVALSVGAGAFLVLWWGRHWRTVRRAKRLVPAP